MHHIHVLYNIHLEFMEFSNDASIDVPNLGQTPIFEWYVVRCGSKVGHQKNMCLKRLDNVLKI